MNFIVFLDICSTVGFGVAYYAVFFIRKDSVYYQTRFFLYILMGLYFFVGITNILEHAGITSFFDPYEEYLEILFMPFFLFFMYTLIAKLDLEKQQEGESALKKALERAEAEQSKSNAILAGIGDGITIQDRNLKILYQNEIHKKMLGDHIGEFCFEAYERRKEPCKGCPVVASFQDHLVHKAERSIQTDKGTLHVEIIASPLINNKGEVYAGIEVARDITDRKRMTEEILRGQKLESIGLLAGGIAHDFNNLLTTLLGNISLAKTYAASNDKVVAKLKAAEKASLFAKELTQQLLTFSRGGAPVKKVLNINKLVRDTCIFSLRGANVKCDFTLSDALWSVEVDPGQMSQVINNLVINADQAMPEGGVIKVSTENVTLQPGNPLLLASGKYILIAIADQGHGIDPEDMTRIFDPFYTTKEDGTGLGLATAFSVIKNHGGLISVESGADSGAVFLIYLPAAGVQVAGSSGENDTVYTGTGSILVMDDEEEIRVLVRDMLEHLGYSVMVAGNGEEALVAYRAAEKENNPFAAVILDLTVPAGMGGLETGRKLLAINPSVKILISSGYSNDPVMANYKQYGFAGIIPKPYKIQEISHKLHGILGTVKKNQG